MQPAVNQKQPQREVFPICLFSLYVLFYSGQSIYNTYLNLYLSSEGLSDSQIGFIISVSTLFILLAQLFWGWVSDRVKVKNRILELLYLATAVISLLFYVGSSFWFLLAAVTFFSIFFNPIIPLQDNYALEYLEKSRWDYGQIRMGGTLGYSVTVLLIGFLLHDDYRIIFLMVAICMALCRMLCFAMPKVSGGKPPNGKHTSWKKLLKNKTLLGLILFNMMFSIGLNFYHNFYPIYYTKIGGNSSMIGAMMFLSAMSEVPMLLIIRKLEDRIGIRSALILAGVATTLRWILLAFVKDSYIVIAVNLLQGLVLQPCHLHCPQHAPRYAGNRADNERHDRKCGFPHTVRLHRRCGQRCAWHRSHHVVQCCSYDLLHRGICPVEPQTNRTWQNLTFGTAGCSDCRK